MRPEELKGHLDGLLLAVLEAGPSHGYAVIDSLRAGSGGIFDLPTGTVYPALHRLEDVALVISTWSDGTGRKRRVYELTTAGRKALAEQRSTWRVFSATVSTVMQGGRAWTPRPERSRPRSERRPDRFHCAGGRGQRGEAQRDRGRGRTAGATARGRELRPARNRASAHRISGPPTAAGSTQ